MQIKLETIVGLGWDDTAVIRYDTYRDTCNAIRYVSQYIDTATATLRSTILVVY